MSTLKRTPENFPKMKVRGKWRPYKRNRQLQLVADMRIARFNKAMFLLADAFQNAGMQFSVSAEAFNQLGKAVEYDEYKR